MIVPICAGRYLISVLSSRGMYSVCPWTEDGMILFCLYLQTIFQRTIKPHLARLLTRRLSCVCLSACKSFNQSLKLYLLSSLLHLATLSPSGFCSPLTSLLMRCLLIPIWSIWFELSLFESWIEKLNILSSPNSFFFCLSVLLFRFFTQDPFFICHLLYFSFPTLHAFFSLLCQPVLIDL